MTLLGLAERLDWLRETVPVSAGSAARYTQDDMLSALTVAFVAGSRSKMRSDEAAKAWLERIRTENPQMAPADAQSERCLAILSLLFRLPPGYFYDAGTARETDERISFAAELMARGVRVIGPCRAPDWRMSVAELHSLYSLVAEALTRRRDS